MIRATIYSLVIILFLSVNYAMRIAVECIDQEPAKAIVLCKGLTNEIVNQTIISGCVIGRGVQIKLKDCKYVYVRDNTIYLREEDGFLSSDTFGSITVKDLMENSNIDLKKGDKTLQVLSNKE